MCCFRADCCDQAGRSEAYVHTIGCGAGTGLYLDIGKSALIAVQDLRSSYLVSPYFDTHGENDPNLDRGFPLFVDADTYGHLRDTLLLHTLDDDMFHPDLPARMLPGWWR